MRPISSKLFPQSIPGTVVAALMINIGLAMLLYQLVAPGKFEASGLHISQYVDFVQLLPVPDNAEARRDKPPPPPPLPQRAPALPSPLPPMPEDAAASASETAELALPLPAMDLPSDRAAAIAVRAIGTSAPLASGTIGANGTGTGAGSGGAALLKFRASEVETNLIPSFKASPGYPLRALKEHIEGKVTVEFLIDRDGNVHDPVIIKGDPPGLFDDAVLAALPKWKFSPRLVNGEPVARRARQDILFNLRKQP